MPIHLTSTARGERLGFVPDTVVAVHKPEVAWIDAPRVCRKRQPQIFVVAVSDVWLSSCIVLTLVNKTRVVVLDNKK